MLFLLLQSVAPPSFADALGNMLHRYLTATTPFALAHLYIAYNVFTTARRINREIKALNSWPNTAGITADSAAALTQFTEECRVWGERGILVPMTDFSDRLDASVMGFVENLHSRMNLFLVVGVAGTFFALFSALFSAFSQPNADYRIIAAALPNALPVGFAGLVLSFAGHYLAFNIEQRFRDAVSKATQRALAERKNLSRSPSDTIRDTLVHLTDVLTKSLEPLLTRLETKIQEATRLTGEQMQPLANAITAFSGVIDALGPQITSMKQAVDKLPDALGRLEQIENSASRMVADTSQAMGTVQERLVQTGDRLAGVAGDLAALPDVLATTVRARLDELTRETSEIWARHAEQVLGNIRPAAEALSGAANRFDIVAGHIEQAHGKLAETAAEAGKAVISVSSEMAARLEKQTAELAERCLQVWQEKAETFAREQASSLTSQLSGIQEAARLANSQLRESADHIERIGQSVSATLKQSLQELHAETISQLKPELSTVHDALVRDYPLLLAALSQSVNDSASLATDFTTITTQVNAAASHLETMSQRLSEANQNLRDVRVVFDDGPLRAEIVGLSRELQALTDVLNRHPVRDWFKRVWPSRRRQTE